LQLNTCCRSLNQEYVEKYIYVVGPARRENEFKNILAQPTFKPIEKQVQFWNYEKVEKLFNAERETHDLRTQIN